ncbi:MAG: hypothetical protein M1326_07075 [Cyanobacteria bacterium]|nr:hypothetical protein [Cyanobacteriota bacterium]
MEENLNKNNKNPNQSIGDKFSSYDSSSDDISNIVSKNYSDSSRPKVIDEYLEILKKRKERQSYTGNIGANLICIIIFLAVCFNVYLVGFEKSELNKIKIQQEQINVKKQDELNKIKLLITQKNKESANLVIFNDKYTKIRLDFYSNAKEISAKSESKFNSLEDIRKLTNDRIKLAQGYKAKLNSIAIPPQLANFYNYEMEFINSDIKLWEIVNAYYNLDDLSKFDINKIDEEARKSHNLFLKAQEELKAVYTKYGLDYFLKDLIFN